MADSESLFSLEVIVQSVEDIRVSCQTPAVTFRLLDFPTVVIRSELKEVCTNEASYQIQCGKSCLFKMSKEQLSERLRNTPLYVMLVDISSAKTKLVASTTISLVNCFENILSNINDKGLDIPAVFGSKGEFEMYNLMGLQVATVKLSYRMFSLGAAMTGHVNLAISKPSKQIHRESVLIDPSSKHLSMENSQTVAPFTTEYSKTGEKQPSKKDMEEKNILQANVYTQTDDIKTQQLNISQPKYDHHPESFVVQKHNNISRPPSLYYNSTSAFIKAKVMPVHLTETNPHGWTTSRQQYCDTSVQTSETFQDNLPTHQGSALNYYENSQVSLPLIEALLNELSLVRTHVNKNDFSQQYHEATGRPTSKNKPLKAIGNVDVPQKRASHEKNKPFKKVVQPQLRKSRVESKPTGANTKGVLISRQPIKFKKSSLKCGTTKTQKLREAITRKKIHTEDNATKSHVEHFVDEQEACSSNNMEYVGIVAKMEKSTMTQDAELQLECKDSGVQVTINEDNFPSPVPSQDILPAPVGSCLVNASDNSNTDGLIQSYPGLEETENSISNNKQFSNHSKFSNPTFSNLSPTMPVASNVEYNSNKRSSEESVLSVSSRFSDKCLVKKPVGERLSKSSYSDNFESDVSDES